MTEYKSEIVQAIEATPRYVAFVDLIDFAIGEKKIGKVAVRVNVIEENNRARHFANVYVDDLAKGNDATKSDEELRQDERVIHAIYEAFLAVKRDPKTGEYVKDADDNFMIDCAETTKKAYPAFPSPSWIRAHLTPDQMAQCRNIYNNVAYKASGAARYDTDEDLADALDRIAVAAPMGVNVVLIQTPHEILCNLGTAAALRVQALNNENATLRAQLEAKELEAVAPDDEPTVQPE